MVRRVSTTLLIGCVIAAGVAPGATAQRRGAPVRKPAAAHESALKKGTADVKCPSLLGVGVKTIRSFCDVPAGRDPAQGVIIPLPPHTGPVTLSFDLHARHTYSEAETRAGHGYSHYRAVIGVLTKTGDVVSRAAVDAEFRTASDLFDRLGGGAGPGGLKAVAPAGREEVFVTIPAGIDEVSLLGETLDATTPAGHETMAMPGRPVAIVSDVLIEYHPAPAKRR